jgi:hypothetical protein
VIVGGLAVGVSVGGTQADRRIKKMMSHLISMPLLHIHALVMLLEILFQ